jgi:mannitol-1-phosphate 5-dehydrogenase
MTMGADAPRLVLFGAGMTGRGQVAQLAFEAGWRLVLVDRDVELVNQLNRAGQYTVRLVSENPRDVVIFGYRALHVSQAEELAAELTHADLVVTSVLPSNLSDLAPTLAVGLRAAYRAGRRQPLNVIAAENMNDSSQALWREVRKHLQPFEVEAFAHEFGFPNSMIARVVPVAQDPLLILAEDYNEWTADRLARVGRPPELAGLEWVENQTARLQRKLYIHNTGHAACAYLGALKGYEFVHQAAQDPQVREWTRQAVYESGAAVAAEHGFTSRNVQEYADDLLARLPSDSLPDSIARVIRDPLRKLGPDERLLGPVRQCEKHGLPRDALCRAVAAVLLVDLPGDRQAIEVGQIVAQQGVRGAVEFIIGGRLQDDTAAALEAHYASLPQEVR